MHVDPSEWRWRRTPSLANMPTGSMVSPLPPSSGSACMAKGRVLPVAGHAAAKPDVPQMYEIFRRGALWVAR